MQFTLTIELGNDELLTGDRRELIAKALSRVASDMRYDRIYKRGIELGRTGEIEVLEKVGSWQVRETPSVPPHGEGEAPTPKQQAQQRHETNKREYDPDGDGERGRDGDQGEDPPDDPQDEPEDDERNQQGNQCRHFVPRKELEFMTFEELAKMFHFLKFLVPSLAVVWVVTMAILARKGVIR